ncbi:MAG: NfrA family protein, partial [Burkholderiaceae bacterium]
LQPRRAAIAEELGYANARAGRNDEAVAWFKKAIDIGLDRTIRQTLVTRLLPEPGADDDRGRDRRRDGDDSDSDGDDSDSGDVSRIYRLRQQVRDMSRRFQFNAYQSYRANARSNVASIVPGFQTGGLIPSQGGVEFTYQPPGIGYRDGRTFRVFSRLLWSNELGSLKPDPHSLQAGLGVQFKPFREQDAYLSLERLVKGGNQSQDNWLVRGSWGWSDGYEMKPGVPSWNQTIVYLDAGYFVQHGPIKSTFGEVRQGRSFNYRNLATITPHLLLAGRKQWPDPGQGSYAEAGVGVAVKALFNETRYEAPRSRVEFTLQYRKTLNRSLPGGWVLSASAQF